MAGGTYVPYVVSNAASNVVTQIGSLKDTATSAINGAAAIASSISGTLSDIPDVEIGELPEIDISDVSFDIDNTFNADSVEVTMPDTPEAFTVSLSPEIDTIDVAGQSFDFNIHLPTRPVIVDHAAPDTTVTLNPVEIPAAPSTEFPDAPVLSELIIPEMGEMSLPSLDAEPPDIADPEDVAGLDFSLETYTSDLITDIEATVLSMLRGGTGLDPAVEQAIYDRADLKQKQDDELALDEVRNRFAATNFGLPTGAQNAAEMQVAKDIKDRSSVLTIEVAIKQAELEQGNRQFAVEQGMKYEELMRSFFISQQTLTLNAASEVYKSAIAIAEAKEKSNRFLLDKYKIAVDVFVRLMEAEAVNLDIYKAKVEGVRVSAEVQKQIIDIYEAQVSAQEAKINVFKLQLEAAALVSQIEQLKVETLKVQADVYGALVNGEKAKAEAYKAGVEGARVEAQIVGEEVNAYRASIEAALAKAQAQQIKVNADLAVEQLKLQSKTNEVEVFKASVTGAVSTAQVQSEQVKTQADVAKTQMQLQASSAEVQARGITAEIQAQEANLNANIKKMEMINTHAIQVAGITTDALSGQMNAQMVLAGGALGGINVSSAWNDSTSYQASLGESHHFTEE